MNKERRKQIEDAKLLLDNALGILNVVKDAEEEAYEAMPESLKSGESGDKCQAAIDALDGAVAYVENAMTDCDNAAE